MRFTSLLLLAFSFMSYCCTAPPTVSHFEIMVPSINQEATSIWNTINDITFFEQQGYTIHLPEDPLIDSLIGRSKKGSFGNDDFASIYALVESKVYTPDQYAKAKQHVSNQLPLLEEFLVEIAAKKSTWDWEFQSFDRYQVVFTLYGTGGSYNPDEGVITLLTNQEGEFVKYQNPAYTIIHEIVHMGMEYSIVQKHQLSHGLKERLVDTFVYLMFHEQLPEYQVQDMGNTSLDAYLTSKEDLGSLNRILSEFVK